MRANPRLTAFIVFAGLVIAGLLIYLDTRSEIDSSVPLVPVTAIVEPAAPPKTLRMLALGDSYTIGEGVAPAERWPAQLVAALRKRGVAIADPTIVARTGWTTDELAAALDRAHLKERYTLATLLIGVNNQYRGRDIGEYRTQFTELLGRVIAMVDGHADRVLVLSIPDWGVTPFGQTSDPAAVAAAIDAFNGVNREETQRAGARYVDITVISRRVAAEPDLLAADGLHPSGKMYAEWVEAVLPAALEAVRR
jgi:lysophospholipase L1-like esterase